MTASTVVKYKAKTLNVILKESYSVIIMFSVYIVGIIFGCLSLKNNSVVFYKAEGLYRDFISSRTDKVFLSQFCSALLDWLPFMLAVFVCGTCIVGMVLSPIFICYKGFCYGALSGYLYSAFSFKGIILVLIFIIPPTLICAFILFFCGARSYTFSLKLAKSVLPGKINEDMYGNFSIYLKESLILIIFSVIASVIDALISVAFFDKINL